MRGLLFVAAAAAAACTPRDNRDADLELRRSPESAVHAEPTVTGGAYDSLTSRAAPARPAADTAAGHTAEPAH